MAKIVSEGQKAAKLLTLVRADAGESSHLFIQGTVKRLYETGRLANLSEKQQKWFNDLYARHFEEGGYDGN